jgi:hypothetical protein
VAAGLEVGGELQRGDLGLTHMRLQVNNRHGATDRHSGSGEA